MKMKSFNFALLASWFFLVFLVILSNDLFVNILLFPTPLYVLLSSPASPGALFLMTPSAG